MCICGTVFLRPELMLVVFQRVFGYLVLSKNHFIATLVVGRSNILVCRATEIG